MTRGTDTSDPTAGPFLFQVEVAAIPEGGWEVSLRAGSGPAWLWWSVAVVVAVLLLLLVCFLLFLAAAWVFRHG